MWREREKLASGEREKACEPQFGLRVMKKLFV